MRTVLCALAFLLVLATPLGAGPCAPYSPYYTRIQTGPGSLLADVLIFTFSAPMATVLIGGRTRPVQNTQTGEVRNVAAAACVPLAVAQHFVQNRPPHVEHWRAYD